MINNAVPGTIDARAINTKKPLNIFQIKVFFFLKFDYFFKKT